LQRSGFSPGTVSVRTVVDKVAVFLQVLIVSHISFIPPLLYAYLRLDTATNRRTSGRSLLTFKQSKTYLLTPWCRVLLAKLTGLQLVKKFSAFHGIRRFITALTSVRHLSLSWASPIQSIYPHPTSWRSILILSTHLHLGLTSGLFPSGFPTKTPYTPLSFLTHTRHMLSPSHSSRFYHPRNIG
jgi:hypothetical protein